MFQAASAQQTDQLSVRTDGGRKVGHAEINMHPCLKNLGQVSVLGVAPFHAFVGCFMFVSLCPWPTLVALLSWRLCHVSLMIETHCRLYNSSGGLDSSGLGSCQEGAPALDSETYPDGSGPTPAALRGSAVEPPGHCTFESGLGCGLSA